MLTTLSRRIAHFGVARYCVCCRSYLRAFGPSASKEDGRKVRENAACPVCKSLERHRATLGYLRSTDLFDGRPKAVLHIAPERHLTAILERVPHLHYISFDLSSRRAMVKGDITQMQFADASFDVILCSHVLEHIPDEAAALREIRRVLKPTGWAMLAVPIIRQGATYEDPTITDEAGRIAAFGQRDHVRAYGHDFGDRLRARGFRVDVARAGAELTQEDRLRFGIRPTNLHICRH